MKGLKGRFATACSVGMLAMVLTGAGADTAYAKGGDDCTADETDWLYPDMINPELVDTLNQTEDTFGLEESNAGEDSDSVETDTENQTAETEEGLRVATGEFTEVNRAYREMELTLAGTVLVSPSAKEPVIVYTETSTESEKAGTMEAGDGASIVEETEEWYQITSGKTEGYVQKSDVITGEKAAIAVVEELGIQAVVDTETINIRLEEDTNADILDVARAGDTFLVIEEGREWTKILYTDGETTGYLATEYIYVEPAIGTALSVEEEAARKAAEEEAARKAAEEEAARIAAEEEAARQAEEAARIAAEEEAARQAAEAAANAKANQAAAEAGVSEGSLQYFGTFRITYYCSCSECCSGGFGHTSSGTIPAAGRTISVNPSQIPYGTHVIINGHEYVAEDSGVGTNQIDVYVNSHEEAIQLGLNYSEVYIKK